MGEKIDGASYRQGGGGWVSGIGEVEVIEEGGLDGKVSEPRVGLSMKLGLGKVLPVDGEDPKGRKESTFRRWMQPYNPDVCILLKTHLSSESIVHARKWFPFGTFMLLSLKIWQGVSLSFGVLVL